jgi:hypothetical protein
MSRLTQTFILQVVESTVGWVLAALTEVFRNYPQSLQAHGRIKTQLIPSKSYPAILPPLDNIQSETLTVS